MFCPLPGALEDRVRVNIHSWLKDFLWAIQIQSLLTEAMRQTHSFYMHKFQFFLNSICYSVLGNQSHIWPAVSIYLLEWELDDIKVSKQLSLFWTDSALKFNNNNKILPYAGTGSKGLYHRLRERERERMRARGKFRKQNMQLESSLYSTSHWFILMYYLSSWSIALFRILFV